MFIFGNLCKSRHVSAAVSRYFSLSRHMGSLQNPPHGVAANVTGRFTARMFDSHKIGGRFWKKMKLCTCKPYNLECHYACIYGFNLFLVLCRPPVSVLVVDYPGRLYISMWLPARESFGGKNNCMWKWLPLVARWTDEMCSGFGLRDRDQSE